MFEEKLLTLHCTSILAPYICDFVAQKRALGYKYNACVEVFNEFDRFCNKHNMESPFISQELLSCWEERRPHENGTTQAIRISYVRGLCKYLHNNGLDVPYRFHTVPKRSAEFVPYIFTKDELARIFLAADKTPITPSSPIRHLIIPVLFRLIYTCGLRASEALRLKICDVDLEQGVITINGAKGDNDRMVGISDSMLKYMRDYRSNPLIMSLKSEYFFPAPDGGFYDTSTIYEWFRKLLFSAGIPHRGRGKGPRIHDLRHSFAVHVLNKWSHEGKNIYTCLPVLRVYLGHARITATEKYLQLVPEAYSELTSPFKDRFRNITEALCNEENI